MGGWKRMLVGLMNSCFNRSFVILFRGVVLIVVFFGVFEDVWLVYSILFN